MGSIWKQNRDVTNKVNRNNFDLTKQCHDTFKFGYLYPVYCKQVYPTDSFRIRTAFDLKMMPMVFPLQSRVRAHMHFFYVRNKNLWKGWEDFISGLKSPESHPHPYVSLTDDKVTTGSIHDFLGVPTTVLTGQSLSYRGTWQMYNQAFPPVPDVPEFISGYYDGAFSVGVKLSSAFVAPEGYSDDMVYLGPQTAFDVLPSRTESDELFLTFDFGVPLSDYPDSDIFYVAVFALDPSDNIAQSLSTGIVLRAASRDGKVYNMMKDVAAVNTMYTLFGAGGTYEGKKIVFVPIVHDDEFSLTWTKPYDKFGMYFDVNQPVGYHQYSGLGLNYYRDHQPLNALPYRAYQSIYYGYYANDVLQPLVIDGEKEYNKFIENDGDGLDTTDYHFYKRNYELDFLTSAMPSPQAGPAPMVGITALGDITITDENGISTGHAEIDSEGIITKIVATSPAASVNHARTMMNIASLGFNINDLRSANALQRLAEQTLRSGYRYVNWVKGQYGRSPEYRELDMPEFIGGFSRDVQIGTVISQADTAAGANGKFLGDFGANGRVVGGSNHDITHYCDDYGWIIGIMSIVPTPAYSQLLSKQMIAPTTPLDYANPFMNQIGMQPITYREVCPIQAYIDSIYDSSKSVDDTFGYQRPNYDAVGDVDEVHGEFRASLKDYLIHRQFDGRPELGSDFIQCSPEEVNDIFVNQNPDDDVFVGNLLFNVSPKRPFPRVHIAGLGR